MRFKTVRFGEIEVDDKDVITFPDGLLGFPHCRRYAILGDEEIEPLKWLQSLEESWLSFVIADPFIFAREYEFEVPPEVAESLGMKGPEDAMVYVILTIGEDIRDTTANLQAPLVISRRTRLGKQLILTNGSYPIRYPVLRREEDADIGPQGEPEHHDRR